MGENCGIFFYDKRVKTMKAGKKETARSPQP
jgi:hypothetical protein